jgi:hypothetical protein
MNFANGSFHELKLLPGGASGHKHHTQCQNEALRFVTHAFPPISLQGFGRTLGDALRKVKIRWRSQQSPSIGKWNELPLRSRPASVPQRSGFCHNLPHVRTLQAVAEETDHRGILRHSSLG